MKFLKTLIGLLALVYVLAHLGALVMIFTQGQPSSSSAYNMGALGGRIFGVIFGLAVAAACFRSR